MTFAVTRTFGRVWRGAGALVRPRARRLTSRSPKLAPDAPRAAWWRPARCLSIDMKLPAPTASQLGHNELLLRKRHRTLVFLA